MAPNELTPHDAADDKADFKPLIDYLQSERGHEIASRVIGIVEDIKKATVAKAATHALVEKWLQAAILVCVVGAACFLSLQGKFDTSVGVLFGTLVGYYFGRQPSK